MLFGLRERMNVSEIVCQVMMDDDVDIELFSTGAQKILRIFYGTHP